MGFLDLIPGLVGLADQLIEDKDKKAEYAFKLQEMAMEHQKTLITMQTTPKVDAGVKIAYTLIDIVQKLWRPAISGFAFIWGLLHPEQLQALADIGTSGEIGVGAVMGSFPAWGVSRHAEKQKKGSTKAPKMEDGDYDG